MTPEEFLGLEFRSIVESKDGILYYASEKTWFNHNWNDKEKRKKIPEDIKDSDSIWLYNIALDTGVNITGANYYDFKVIEKKDLIYDSRHQAVQIQAIFNNLDDLWNRINSLRIS